MKYRHIYMSFFFVIIYLYYSVFLFILHLGELGGVTLTLSTCTTFSEEA